MLNYREREREGEKKPREVALKIGHSQVLRLEPLWLSLHFLMPALKRMNQKTLQRG